MKAEPGETNLTLLKAEKCDEIITSGIIIYLHKLLIGV